MNNNNAAKCLFSGIIGAISAIVSLGLSVKNQFTLPFFNSQNISALIVSCMVYFSITIVCYLVLNICKIKLHDKIKYYKIVYALFILVTLVLFCGMLKTDDGFCGAGDYLFWWHQLPFGIVVLIFTLLSAVGVFIVIKYRNSIITNKKLLYIYYSICALVYSGTVVYINVFAGDLYHIDAYLHPIYSVFYNTPYSNFSYSIYGHYELFYKIPMLIFGTSPRVICLTLMVVAFIEAFVILKIIDDLVSSKIIKLFVPFALMVPTGCMFVSSSYQSTPHRIIFPVLLILYGLKLVKNKKAYSTKDMLIGNLICTFAIIWNTETGLMCCLAWIGYSLARMLQKETMSVKNTILRFFTTCIMMIVDIILALCFVNFYNFCVGGGRFIRGFFYPFINSGFMNNYILEVPFGNRPYIYILVLALGAITYGASKTKIFKRNTDEYEPSSVIFMTGILLLGQLAYYMTRAAYYGLLITFPFALILMTYFADFYSRHRLSDNKKCGISLLNTIERGIAGTQIAALTILIVMCINLPICFKYSYGLGRYNWEDYKNAFSEIEAEVEPNTYAVGWGVDEIYGVLGWDTGYHLLGTTDTIVDIEANEAIYNQLIAEANSKDHVFLTDEAYKILGDDYRLVKEYTIYGEIYGYFEKIK